MDTRKIDDAATSLASRLGQLLPSQLEDAREDLTRNFRAVLKGWFESVDLVTREEFDVQRAVLQRTREKVEELQAIVAELESASSDRS